MNSYTCDVDLLVSRCGDVVVDGDVLDLPISTAFIDAQIEQRRDELNRQRAALEAELAQVDADRARARSAVAEADQRRRAADDLHRQIGVAERGLAERHQRVEAMVVEVERHRQDLEGLLDAVSVFAAQAGTMLDLVSRRVDGVDRAAADLLPPFGR